VAEPPAPVLQLPGGPDAGEPVPRTPIDGFDLAAYAGVAAALAQRAEPRAVTLARAGLNEARWTRIEKTWLLRIAGAFLRQDVSLGKEHDDAFQAAQAALAGDPATTLEEYAALIAEIEGGRDAAQAMTCAGLSPAAFAAVQRRWTARVAADPGLASSFRAMVAARRGG
jgi:hypothetical protein